MTQPGRNFVCPVCGTEIVPPAGAARFICPVCGTGHAAAARRAAPPRKIVRPRSAPPVLPRRARERSFPLLPLAITLAVVALAGAGAFYAFRALKSAVPAQTADTPSPLAAKAVAQEPPPEYAEEEPAKPAENVQPAVVAEEKETEEPGTGGIPVPAGETDDALPEIASTVDVPVVYDEPDDYDPPPDGMDDGLDAPAADAPQEPEGSFDLIRSAIPREERPAFLRPLPAAALPRLDPASSASGRRRAAFRRSPGGVSFRDTPQSVIFERSLECAGRLPPEARPDSNPADSAGLDRAWIMAEAGAGAVARIAALEGGVEFLDDFFNDPVWMEEFAGSGTAKHGWGAALETLALLHWNDTRGWMLATDEGRRLATALALNCRPGRDEENVMRYLAYMRICAEGRMHSDAARNTCVEWRCVVNQGYDPGEIPVVNRAFTGKREKYPSVLWRVPYRLFNCFGESIHGPHYYEPWLWLRRWAEVVERVGGVCGALSTYSSRTAASHGIMSVTAGQPGHLAYLLKKRGENWAIHNYIKKRTRPGWSILGPGLYSLPALDAMYADPGAAALSERNRRLAETVRRMEKKKNGGTEKYSAAVESAYAAATGICPCNVLAWRSYRDWLGAVDAPDAVWAAAARRAASTMAASPWSGWETVDACLGRAAKSLSRAQMLKLLREIHSKMRESAYRTRETFDFQAVLRGHAKLLGGDPAACAELFDSVTLAQQGTPGFFSEAVAWAGDAFLKDPAASAIYLKTVERLADPATYKGRRLADKERADAARGAGAVPHMPFEEVIWAAVEARNPDAYAKALQICRKFDRKPRVKEPPKDANGKKRPRFPRMKFGGEIVSGGAIPRPHPLLRDAKANDPSRWDAFSDETPCGLTTVSADEDKAPSVELRLPRPVELRGAVVCAKDPKDALLAAPFRLLASENGKDWRLLYEEKEGAAPKERMEIDLRGEHMRTRLLRAERAAGVTNAPFALSKMVIYGKKTN